MPMGELVSGENFHFSVKTRRKRPSDIRLLQLLPTERIFLGTEQTTQEEDLNLKLSLGGVYDQPSKGEKPLMRSSSVAGVISFKEQLESVDTNLSKSFLSLSRSCSVPAEKTTRQIYLFTRSTARDSPRCGICESCRNPNASSSACQLQRNYLETSENSSEGSELGGVQHTRNDCFTRSQEPEKGKAVLSSRAGPSEAIFPYRDLAIRPAAETRRENNGLTSYRPLAIRPAAETMLVNNGLTSYRPLAIRPAAETRRENNGLTSYRPLAIRPAAETRREHNGLTSYRPLAIRPAAETRREHNGLTSYRPLASRPANNADYYHPNKRPRLVPNGSLIPADSMEVNLRRMPSVSATGDGPRGKTIEGILYQCTRGQVCIICACHGSFLSPAEFVRHAGGADVPNPMKRISVYPDEYASSEETWKRIAGIRPCF